MHTGQRPIEKGARSFGLTIVGKLEARLLVVFLVVVGLALAFGHIVEEMLEGDSDAFDRILLLAFRNPTDLSDPIGPPWVEELVRDVTALGSFAVLSLITFSLVFYLLLIRYRAAAMWVTASIAGGLVLDNLLKLGFERPRQDIVPAVARVFTTSFPSGHAMEAAVVYLTVGLLLADLHPSKLLRAYFLSLAIALTIAVGTSRVYLGLHYPTDVLAGWCVGAAWALICWGVAQWLQRGSIPPREAA